MMIQFYSLKCPKCNEIHEPLIIKDVTPLEEFYVCPDGYIDGLPKSNRKEIHYQVVGEAEYMVLNCGLKLTRDEFVKFIGENVKI